MQLAITFEKKARKTRRVVVKWGYGIYSKTPENIECYVAVNFSSKNDNCGGCPRGKHCDYLNDKVFYRILPKYEAETVYRKIVQLFES